MSARVLCSREPMLPGESGPPKQPLGAGSPEQVWRLRPEPPRREQGLPRALGQEAALRPPDEPAGVLRPQLDGAQSLRASASCLGPVGERSRVRKEACSQSPAEAPEPRCWHPGVAKGRSGAAPVRRSQSSQAKPAAQVRLPERQPGPPQPRAAAQLRWAPEVPLPQRTGPRPWAVTSPAVQPLRPPRPAGAPGWHAPHRRAWQPSIDRSSAHTARHRLGTPRPPTGCRP